MDDDGESTRPKTACQGQLIHRREISQKHVYVTHLVPARLRECMNPLQYVLGLTCMFKSQ